ncbi:Rho-binding antiterminator [Halomonas litopenaei]|uniref:Rho-binding antiterminator n=1 Tax=Halomonas litopenaei TaxID=2109328 RepID=UPI001A9012C2|nr:Rho-binding antiterminator [Halomonas litopenaei]MBN8412128.1 Rho-binding antiterminator [Halomonas litopenaei]
MSMVACHLYDNIELACLYHFPVKLSLKGGVEKQGEAVDTSFNEDHEECLSLRTEGGDRLVVLNDITRMEVLVDNPHFMVLDFV